MAPAWTEKLDGLAESLFRDGGHWPEQKIVHDSVWGTQPFEGWEVAIMDLPLLQRLRCIHQTSLAYLTFPTALHTRFDHSLGVCSGTKQLVAQVLGVKRNDPQYQELSVAALLHDIGHGPFSHLSEDTYATRPALFDDLLYTTDTERPVRFPKAKPHEVIGALLLATPASQRFFNRLNEHYDTKLDPERLGNIITGNGVDGPFEAFTLVNGPFDADKIDYLRRDSAFSGVPIALDFDRLVHSLEARLDSESGEKVVAINIRGVVSAEQILFGKATLNSAVYHHHKVRAADCLFKAIAERMFETKIGIDGKPFEDPTDMLRFVDADFTRWTVSYPGQELVKDERLRRLLRLLSRRELPVRIKELSHRSLDGACLEEMFRYRDPSHADADLVNTELIKLRKDIATLVREATGDPTVYEDEIWIDLPRSPQLGNGTVINSSGRLQSLSDLFPTRQWVEYYKQHRYMGYVLGPRRHRAKVEEATVSVLADRGIEFSGSLPAGEAT